MPFKMHKILFFQKKIIRVPTLPKIFRPVTRNTLFYLASTKACVVGTKKTCLISRACVCAGYIIHSIAAIFWRVKQVYGRILKFSLSLSLSLSLFRIYLM